MPPTRNRKRLSPQRQRRRNLFRKALKSRHMTVKAFYEAGGYSRQHLNEVLNGDRTSRAIDAQVAALIKAELHEMV